LTMGAGQFCTNPGIAVVLEGDDSLAFAQAARDALAQAPAQAMLTDGIAQAYTGGAASVADQPGIETLIRSECGTREARPFLFRVKAEDWLGNETLAEEVFGPLGLVVRVGSVDEMVTLAKGFEGQLTTTIQMDDADLEDARKLLPVLERRSGRVLANGFPTGVEVCDAMVHGGPYPASTNFGATSVGTMSIRRFLRPVSYQNIPDALLPADH
ncbi:MAG: aldehyde dehydrogenase (NADP(+)), partial [Paracoccus sp. (in: a-proteobacteria)]